MRAAARLLAAAVLALGAQAAPAALYKWVDDKGIVHYTDKMPPDEVGKGSTQLNAQGVPLKKVAPETPPEQRRARELEQQRERTAAQEAAKQSQEAARRDRALLDSFTSEADIDLARKRAIGTLQTSIKSAQDYSAVLAKRKAALQQAQPAAGKPASADTQRELGSIDAELTRQSAFIAQQQKQLAEADARYAALKARWHELRGGAASPPPAATPPSAARSPGEPVPAARK